MNIRVIILASGLAANLGGGALAVATHGPPPSLDHRISEAMAEDPILVEAHAAAELVDAPKPSPLARLVAEGPGPPPSAVTAAAARATPTQPPQTQLEGEPSPSTPPAPSLPPPPATMPVLSVEPVGETLTGLLDPVAGKLPKLSLPRL